MCIAEGQDGYRTRGLDAGNARNPVQQTTEERASLRYRARQLDSADQTSLPLYGIPFVIKDNIDFAGLPTTAGCPAFAYQPESSAPVVQALIDAGAIALGKTNLDQFATGLVGTRSPYGACKNAFDPALVRGRTVAALSGTFTTREALDALLRGQGLEVSRTGLGAYVVKQASASPESDKSVLPTIRVVAAQEVETPGAPLSGYLALRHALSSKAKSGHLVVLDSAIVETPKTAALRADFAKIGVLNALVITGPEVDAGFKLAARNIPSVDVLPNAGINVYDILRRDTLVLTKAALEGIAARFASETAEGEAA